MLFFFYFEFSVIFFQEESQFFNYGSFFKLNLIFGIGIGIEIGFYVFIVVFALLVIFNLQPSIDILGLIVVRC